MSWHLPRTNIGVAGFTYGEPGFADFVGTLDRINAIADQSPGFVWRFVQDDEHEAGREIFDDENVLFDMSARESKGAHFDCVYHTDPVDILRRRAEWFVKLDRPIMALRWIPAGSLPTVADAGQRLHLLAQKGPAVDAFTFRQCFAPPENLETAHG